ncbi:MAG: hypothetical protein HY554_12940 [Elusimicrobia bacterium]|nr:hypothetical protein [Elusimicrobiota bacterium]
MRLPDLRRAALFAVPLAGIVGLVVALDWGRRRPETLEVAPVGTLLPPSPAASGSETPADRLFQAASAPARGELSFQDFLDVLGVEAEKPAVVPLARSLREGFMAEPSLKRTYERFQRRAAEGKQPTAHAFLSTLRSSPEFKKIAAPFVGSPGGAAAFNSLVQNDRLKRLLLDEKRALAANPGGATARDKRPVVGRQPKGGGPGAPSAPPAGSGAGIPAPPGSVTAQTPGGEVGSAYAAGQASPGPGAGPPAHDVGKLEPTKDEVTRQKCEREDTALRDMPWLVEIKDKLRDIERGLDKYGDWGACFAVGVYGRCESACLNAKNYHFLDANCRPNLTEEVKCSPPKGGGWEACTDFLKGELNTSDPGVYELKCIPKCEAQTPCAVPDEVRKNYCTARGRDPWSPPQECGIADEPTAVPDAQKSCADIAKDRGWAHAPLMGEQCAKAKERIASKDGLCCDAAGSCGVLGREAGFIKAHCDITGEKGCGERGRLLKAWDCESCCETSDADTNRTCEDLGRLAGFGDYACRTKEACTTKDAAGQGRYYGIAAATVDGVPCEHCCGVR